MRTLAKNKRARFDYDISTTWQLGIVLVWHEVKACKVDHCSITEAIIVLDFHTQQLEIKWMNIPLYSKTSPVVAHGYEPKRSRSLLVNHRERTKIASQLKQGNYTLIPLELIELKNRRIKIMVWLAQRRRKVEKRQILKERDISKEMRKEIKDY